MNNTVSFDPNLKCWNTFIIFFNFETSHLLHRTIENDILPDLKGRNEFQILFIRNNLIIITYQPHFIHFLD